MQEGEVLEWLVNQRLFEALPELTRNDLDDLVAESDYLSILFYANMTHEESTRALRRASLIAENAGTFGIPIAKMNDALMAKRFGVKELPGLVLFRKGRNIKYEDDLEDEEEMLDWLTAPENMILRDQIEVVNRKMLDRMRETTEHLSVLFFSETDCKQCEKVVSALEEIDDEADQNGIAFVRIDDWELAKAWGVHALPSLLYWRLGSDEPIIFAGDLRSPQKILDWLLQRKNPTGTAIEEAEGDYLRKLIQEEDSSIVVYFFNQTVCNACEPEKKVKKKKKEGKDGPEESPEGEAERLAGCALCKEILEELENVDDQVARHGVTFYRTPDVDFATEIGVGEHLPAIVYFEDGVASVFEGSLTIEEDVLHWIVEHKTESRIELITRGMMEQALIDTAYLAVFFYKQPCRACDTILMELENIDDECDSYGIHMVKIADVQLAKRYGITSFPALLYFRNGNPLLFDGDLKNEESVLDWLTDEENRELADEIESVNSKMLQKLVDSSPFLAVFFFDENECEEDCENILLGLEEIDDEADSFGIDMVKVIDSDTAAEFGVMQLPALAYFRRGATLLYEGDLMDPAAILGWLTSNEAFELKDEIEEVNRKMLDHLLEENPFVVVFFEEEEETCPTCGEILEELERIDQEVENFDILFVRIDDTKYAKKWGITKIPSLVYFRKKFPAIYRGDLMDELAVLDWLQKNRYKQPELNLFMFALACMSLAFVVYTVFILVFLKHPENSS